MQQISRVPNTAVLSTTYHSRFTLPFFGNRSPLLTATGSPLPAERILFIAPFGVSVGLLDFRLLNHLVEAVIKAGEILVETKAVDRLTLTANTDMSGPAAAGARADRAESVKG